MKLGKLTPDITVLFERSRDPLSKNQKHIPYGTRTRSLLLRRETRYHYANGIGNLDFEKKLFITYILGILKINFVFISLI